MTPTKYFLIALAAMASLCSCIHNDIPYARIQAGFTSLQAMGQDGGTIIDSATRSVTIPLPEQVDIQAVRISSYTLTPGATIVDNPLGEPIDLSSPLTLQVRLYQDWTWHISATQTIERYFEVAAQMGASVIDVPGRRVVLFVKKNSDIANIEIIRAKLGPVGATYSPALDAGAHFDGTKPFVVDVEQYGRTYRWTIYVETVEATVVTTGVDAWTCVAWVHGQAEAGRDNGVEYRLATSQQWVRIPADAVTQTGGAFTGRIDHLSPQTQYVARTYSDNDTGDEVEFTTGSVVQPPNRDFEYWWLDGKIWCPWKEDGEPYWGTGNKGATTLGTSNSVPTTDTPSGTGWAAQLETRFVGIGILGKLAAGNLFAGSYVRTDGTNGVLSFGRPFTERPTKLQGMFRYNCTTIDKSSNEMSYLIGRPDTCIVWVALIDTPEPFEIRTSPSNRQLFDPNGDYVVAYGCMQHGESIPAWTPFEFELTYRSTSRKPTYILITCSASKYGDYFTGGNGSILCVDDFELLYDY